MIKITAYLELNEEATQLEDSVNGVTIALTFSESAVLAYLLQSESVCTKESLLEVGWPNRVVAATSLTQCISTLRKKLEPYSEVILKTVARRGYELHVAKQSTIKVLAVNDAKSLKSAFLNASMIVKVMGLIPLLAVMLVGWYCSDYHQVMKQISHWHADKMMPLNIGGVKADTPVLYQSGDDNFTSSMWQKHLNAEHNHIDGLQNIKSFASHVGSNYSIASCLNVVDNQCTGSDLINITAINKTPAGLDMDQFILLAKKLEKRIRYNKIIISESDDEVDFDTTEHSYHADVYFPRAGKRLFRSDMSLSLIYEEKDKGIFYSSVCITDEDCLTSPIKYKLNGEFTQYHKMIDGMDVDVFLVKVKNKEFIKPDVVTPEAMHFYRSIRKHNIKDKVIYFYRIHTDDKSAVWINPILGNIVAWYEYKPVVM
ncbi:transcriptional regulator [Shewanella intestini]|uniref:CadC family transcriptional regulator n=1 Tax=Shewanella intestini TaxID=2017544 RepID=A0ABS5I445_9GAMM|nr:MULTISPECIES: winged helix-turn-helix domain-containing protein [Shewanella]MBR9728798.1 CadC family transcriptional regulator [Shewanella intestini]MRG36873.1 CadC family transcriptional regulator [Shewanella sp. XMDDZSB0408]